MSDVMRMAGRWVVPIGVLALVQLAVAARAAQRRYPAHAAQRRPIPRRVPAGPDAPGRDGGPAQDGRGETIRGEQRGEQRGAAAGGAGPTPGRHRDTPGRTDGAGSGLDAARAGRWARRTRPVDPFTTLAVQQRLGRLADDLEDLAGSGVRTGERRYRWALWRYDATLAQACRLAGIPARHGEAGSRDVTRLLTEAALDGRGWTW